MKVAVGQFAVQPEWRANAATCIILMQEATGQGARLLVLPEAVLARHNTDPEWGINAAQPLDGEFVAMLLEASRGSGLTTVLTIHTPESDGRVFNTLLAIREGEMIAHYHKLHLYDAFNFQESARVTAGRLLPPLIDVAGMKVGLMTCYDLRFPDLALRLALAGAEVIAMPAAWVRGAHKEHHWATLLAARALDTTCYLVASGECGVKNIGCSRVISPMGVTLAAADEQPALFYAELSAQRLAEVRKQLPVLTNRRFRLPELAENERLT